MSVSPDWPSRYRDGHRDQVWDALRQLGSAVRDPELAPYAQQVCDEMARRARHNIKLITERLAGQGYLFHTNDDDQKPVRPNLPPSPDAGRLTDWLTTHVGSVPMTLVSWIRIVGDVWLVGTHPQWPESAAADPLVIQAAGLRYPNESIYDHYQGELAAHAETPEAGLFVLPVAPDRLHKDNVSGGAPYGIIVPDGCADGLFVTDMAMPFVSYLNAVFRNGGFPWPTGAPQQGKLTRELARDLLPL